jgi:predicted site-specific integrase-resolvase
MAELLGVAKIAERYGVHTNTAQRWCREGRFPNARRESGVWLVPESDLEGFERPRPGPKPRDRED